jgi:AcrR family transcriptional regulator
MLTQKGYDGVTMRELALKSDVALKTLCDVYGSKDDLLVEAVHDRVVMVFKTAEAAAGGLRGVARLLYFVDSGGHATVATPTLSRAIAPFVVGPVDRFGFVEIYDRCHGSGLRDIEAAGELQPWADVPGIRDRLMIAIAGVLLLWAKEQITTKRLVLETRLAAALVLAPVVTGRAHQLVVDVIRSAYDELYTRKRAIGAPAVRKRRGGAMAA